MNEIKTTERGYKGFKDDLTCMGFQYKVGETYEMDEEVKLCNRGFHFCKNPHDIFSYYSAGENNRFCEIEAEDVSNEKMEDSKRVCKKIKITAEISVFQICKIAVSAFFENFGFKEKIGKSYCNNAGDCGAANAGDCGAANAGNYGAANAGNYGAAVVSNNGKVKGGYGCILVARNIEVVNYELKVTDWACGIVDNITLKENTWYCLKDGKLIECE